jgi:hypothetical protein
MSCRSCPRRRGTTTACSEQRTVHRHRNRFAVTGDLEADGSRTPGEVDAAAANRGPTGAPCRDPLPARSARPSVARSGHPIGVGHCKSC